MNLRISNLRSKLEKLNIQGAIIKNPINIRYLTNLTDEGTLLITRKENIFISDGRYIENINKTLTIDDGIVVQDSKNLCKEDYENFFIFCENIGFEENYLTFEEYKEIMCKYKINNICELNKLIEKQRIIKENIEIENIKKACKLTDECFLHVLGFIKKGLTEKEIALEMQRFFKINGAEDEAFKTIVASGKNSSLPHANPTDKKIESGDVILLDFGCRYNGYNSDMSRTIFVDYIDEKTKKVYDIILKNQENAILELKEGTNIKTISKNVEKDFEFYGYNLIHSLGHAVGLEIHEMPYINCKNENMLKENMIITIEPRNLFTKSIWN